MDYIQGGQIMDFLMSLPNWGIYLAIFFIGATIWYFIVKWLF